LSAPEAVLKNGPTFADDGSFECLVVNGGKLSRVPGTPKTLVQRIVTSPSRLLGAIKGRAKGG
jgi:hypothetical protein